MPSTRSAATVRPWPASWPGSTAQPLDGSLDEQGAAARLRAERAKDPLFRGPSFDTISAHGPNAALPHYRATPESNRKLTGGTLYLIDSGGQYLDATTDITRTVALGAASEEMRERFTLVLKGMIAISLAVFPEGTSGAQIDAFARAALWRHGLDFDHGTGHGVGSYLCVHEGPGADQQARHGAAQARHDPQQRARLLQAGRLRHPDRESGRGRAARPKPEGGDRELLGFRTLTLCPIDRRLIVPGAADGRGARLARRLPRAGPRGTGAAGGRGCGLADEAACSRSLEGAVLGSQ